MNVRIRDRIESTAGPMDEAHGMPFVLGRPVRVPMKPIPPDADGMFVIREDCVFEWVWLTCDGHLDGAHVRRWLACVRLPDGTWRHDYAFCDSEIFEELR